LRYEIREIVDELEVVLATGRLGDVIIPSDD